MDYRKLIDYHIEKNSELTISAIRVPEEDTNRFGMLKVDDQNRVVEFEEKPKQTDSRLASMGVYVFSWQRV